jgi:hypothetical protein
VPQLPPAFGRLFARSAPQGNGIKDIKDHKDAKDASFVPQVLAVLAVLVSSTPFQIALALLAHWYLWPRWLRLCQLPQGSYFAPFLVPQILNHSPLVLFLVVNLGLLLVFRRRLAWREIDSGGRTRWLIFGAAAILAWAFSTYDVNLYFGQVHLLERFLLLGLLALLLVHPLFIVPFLGLLLVLALQLVYPLPEGAWMWPDKRLPLDALILFNAFLLTRIVTRARAHVFPLLVLSLTGASYAHAAIEKLRLGPYLGSWLSNHTSNIRVSAFTNGGWLRGLGEERVVSLARAMSHTDLLMGIGTLLIEASGFLILVSPRATRFVLCGFLALHVAILATTGIFFWKWMLFDLALLWYVKRDATSGWQLYSRRNALLVMLVVAGTRLYFYNIDYAWFDSRVANFFVLRGIGASGKEYRLEPRFFSPYDLIAQQSRFYYLTERPVLAGTYGTTHDFALLRDLETARVEDLPRLRAEHGRKWTNAGWARLFGDFVQRFTANAQARGSKHIWLNRLAPPHHFQTTLAPNAYDFQEPLTRVEVDFEEHFFDGQRIVPTVRETEMIIPLPAGVREKPPP